MNSPAPWRRRFTAPVIRFPAWSTARPDTIAYVSSEGGSLQVWALDRRTDERRPLTAEPLGVEAFQVLPDGSGIAWWQDRTGDESGRWMVTPFDGGATTPLLDDAPEFWSEGLGLAPGVTAIASSDELGYRVWVSHNDGPPVLVADSKRPLGIGREWEKDWNGLSADGSLLCIRHAEAPGADITRSALRVLSTTSGDVVSEQIDPGQHLRLSGWSPIPGDQRISFDHERDGWWRPAVWDVAADTRTDMAPDLPGEIDVMGWWPDGSALLGINAFEGQTAVVRIDAMSGDTAILLEGGGRVTGAAVRPDGAVWARVESPTTSPRTIDVATGEIILAPLGELLPAGRPYTSRWDEADGRRVHTILATPEGAAPFPTVLAIHGGPEWAYGQDFEPWIQALVDHGYAVAMVNYRGSTGYGREFRESIVGNYGVLECEDVVRALDSLVADGIADSKRIAIEGWSWGGYISLLAPGLYPGRFAAAVGGIPVGDSIACHEDANPAQQAWDIAMLGGSPEDIPDVYAERSPITYVDRWTEPVLIIAGEHDSACPIRQVNNFVDAARASGHRVDTLIYEGGHHANAAEQSIAFAERELAFFAEYLGGRPPDIG